VRTATVHEGKRVAAQNTMEYPSAVMAMPVAMQFNIRRILGGASRLIAKLKTRRIVPLMLYRAEAARKGGTTWTT
jgi:hypothetical protein